MDWYWWALIVAGVVVAWYVGVGRWIASDLRKEKEETKGFHYFIWAFSPVFAVFLVFWYTAWLLSGGLIPSPHKTMSEGDK